jgi:imidazolonepropionase
MDSMPTLIRDIAALVVVPPGPLLLSTPPPVIDNAAILMHDGCITWFGPASEVPKIKPEQTISAGGGLVVPGLVDCHTHAVFAGSREGEFVQRIKGASYLEILEAGGGIRNTMRSVRAASEDELVAQSLPRIKRMIASGSTTIECKSGYGLSPHDELKQLRAIRRLAEMTSLDMPGTYLGAHALPPEFMGRPHEYLAQMTGDKLLTTITSEGLASFADAFCEKGAFTPDQTRVFLTRCAAHGLTPKLHAEQITNTGSTRLAVELAAASADHLECINDDDITVLKGGKTIPVLLPGCTLFLNGPPAPARKLIDAGLPVALATDCNPGSSMIESMPLIMSIAATMLRMTPMETLIAATANAAGALRMEDKIGAIAVGHQADLLVVDAVNVDQWVYRMGANAVRLVIKRGRILHPS